MNMQDKLLSLFLHADPDRERRAIRFFRAGLALVILVQALWTCFELPTLVGEHGLMQAPINEAFRSRHVPSLAWFSFVWNSVWAPESTIIYVCFGLYITALVHVVLNWQPQAFSVLALFMHLLFKNSGAASIYGAHEFAANGLFFCMMLPDTGASIAPAFTGMSQFVLRFYLAIVYLSSGIAKAQGPDWRDGQAIWNFLTRPEITWPDYSWISSYPLVPMILGWMVLAMEIGYPVTLLVPRSRKPMLLLALAMHLGIAFTMQLWIFSATMVVLNLAALGPWNPLVEVRNLIMSWKANYPVRWSTLPSAASAEDALSL